MREYSGHLQRHPADLRMRLKLAEVCRLLGRLDEAVRLYRGTAVCHALAGNLAQAIVVCQQILKIRPFHDETQRMLARIYGSRRVRQAKQAVPVRQQGDRWVAEPEQDDSSTDVHTSPASPNLALTVAHPPAHKRIAADLRPEDRELAEALELVAKGDAPDPTDRADLELAPVSESAGEPLAHAPTEQAVPYSTLQREVVQEGQQCADSEPDSAERAHAEQELQAAFVQVATDEEAAVTDGLPHTPLFSQLDTEQFVALLDRLEVRVYEAGEMVVQEGDDGDALMVVAAGELQVIKQRERRQIPLANLTEGCFFGEFGLLNDRRRYASVQCLKDCEILVLQKDVLSELVADHPGIAETLQRFYERRVVEMVLATSPLFRVIGPQERAQAVARFVRQRVEPGQTLVLEGTAGEAFCVLLVGQVEVTRLSETGEDTLLGVLSEGDYFGEMSLISGEPAGATVRTTRTTELLSLSSASFYELAATYPKVWSEVQRQADAREALNEHALNERKARALLL